LNINDIKESQTIDDMELDDFEEDIFEPSISVRFVDESETYSPLMYEDLPTEYQDILDNIASEILDPHSGHVGIVGTALAGKTFLIHQLVGNIDRYLDRLERDNMHFIHVDDDDLDNIMSLPNRYHTYISCVMSQLSCSERDITFYTEDPSVAAKLFSFTKKARIILEASHSTVEGIAHMEHSGATKVWGSWTFIDVNEIFLKKKDLVNLLHMTLNEKIMEAFKVDLDRKTISLFLNHCLKNMPELLGQEGTQKNRVLVPIGIWSVVLRRMGGVMGLSESAKLRSRNNQIVMAKVIESVYSDNAELFQDFVQEENSENLLVIPSPDGRSALRIPIPTQLFEQLQAQEQDDDDKPVIAQKLAFNKIDELEQNLHKEVIGQDPAIDTIVESMVVPAAGLNDDSKPIKTMLFLGPTGTGKTKMALTLAKSIAEEPLNVIRIDMSEYSQAHEAAKLLGAPPGYAGFEKGGVLTNAVKKHPNSLILLDEIEKAHAKIWDSFLQIFDAGRMTDGSGNTIDFTQTVIVMTSNIGASKISKKSPGFSAISEAEAYDKRQKDSKTIITKALEDEFRPELINRIDELVIFNELSLETSRKIVRKEIGILEERMTKQGYVLGDIENDIIDEILSKSNVSKYGAREIQRVILRNLSSPIARNMLDKPLAKSDKELIESSTLKLILDKEKNILVKKV